MCVCVCVCVHRTVVRHSIVHRALMDYLLHCSTEARAVSHVCTCDVIATPTCCRN